MIADMWGVKNYVLLFIFYLCHKFFVFLLFPLELIKYVFLLYYFNLQQLINYICFCYYVLEIFSIYLIQIKILLNLIKIKLIMERLLFNQKMQEHLTTLMPLFCLHFVVWFFNTVILHIFYIPHYIIVFALKHISGNYST